ncbi:hypothetical protein E0485_17140, partial [Paenibacillus albiflavus]
MKRKQNVGKFILSFCLVVLLVLQTLTFSATAYAGSAPGDSGTVVVSEFDPSNEIEPSGSETVFDAPEGQLPVSMMASPMPEYSITMRSNSNASENGWINQAAFVEGAIEWQVEIAATDMSDPTILLPLADLKFYDALDPVAIGTYVESSFKVNGVAATPDNGTTNALAYTFPAGFGEHAMITFKTWIPKEKYYREYNAGDSGWQTVTNAVELRDASDNKLLSSSPWSVALKPDWIQMIGTLDKQANPADPRTITWTIDVNKNYSKQGLKDFTITDALPAGLTFKSAAYQLWNSGTNDWFVTNELITPSANNVYTIGDVNGPIRLVIVSEVTGNTTSFTNKAITQWKLDVNTVQDNTQTTVWDTATVNSSPSITAQPSNSTIAVGGNTTFSVSASNTTGYQWQVDQGAGYTNISNGAPYSGATTATLTITGATARMNGYIYRVIASGLATPDAASNGATLTVNSPPSIIAQPSSSTIAAGGNTTFSVLASNTTGYQWQVDQGAGYTNISNGAPYSGATTATLTITGATARMNGYIYRVIASGLATPDAASNGATLTVNSPPSIIAQPSSSTIAAGGNTTFSVLASNTTGYQWQVDQGAGYTNISNGAPYSGATTATLTITGATARMNGYIYRVIASGLATPDAASNGATLTVNSPPSIIAQPSSSTIAAGGNTTFSVLASNTTGYQWQVDQGAGYTNISNGAPYSGATTATLTITGATARMNGYIYRVIASGLATPDAASNGATLTVNSPPSIIAQPSSSTIAAGGNTTFSVLASNTTGYQWQVDQGAGYTNISNGAPYSGATTATLTITGATARMNGYIYRVIASGLATPDAASNGATLTVNSPPSIIAQPSSST